ncbi:hypothetical protein C0991_008696 [Blastosporella zonata]|nr:hypothetical protein C0991_008696 [Blastosporella zonata]
MRLYASFSFTVIISSVLAGVNAWSAASTTTSPKSTETIQKNIKDWEVLQLDPRGGPPCFANSHISPEYASYNPPRGYTADEIMQFQAANEVFGSVEEVKELLALRDKYGSLELEHVE